MFIFSEFVVDYVHSFADVYALCLTSYESVDYIKRYYVCVKPQILPFPKFKLQQKFAQPWEKFINFIMSKSFFKQPSDLRLRLCALLDYLYKSRLAMTTAANPRRDITIRFKNNTYSRGHMTKHYPQWSSAPDQKEPFFFQVCSVKHKSTVQGIVFTDAEYSRELETYVKLFNFTMDVDSDDMKPIYFFRRMHVVKTLQCTWVIVFLYSKPKGKKMLVNRCKLQERYSDEELERREKKNNDELVDAFIHRFYP